LGQEFYRKKKTLKTEGGLSSIVWRKEAEKCEIFCAGLKPENNLLGLLDLM
jgi:hypothetical protein